MLHNTESGSYRLYQSSRFEDYREPIKPRKVEETALFVFDDFESSHGEDLCYIANEVCSEIDFHRVHILLGDKIDIEKTIRELDSVIEYKNNRNIPVVINCSWHTEANEKLARKFKECVESGIHIFCAADRDHDESFLPGAIEGVQTVGYIDTNFRQKNIGDIDFFIPGEAVKTETGSASGSSVSSVLAAAAMCYLHSFVAEDSVVSSFKNMIIEKRTQFLWPFVLDSVSKFSKTTFNIDTVPTIEYLDVYKRSKLISDITNEKCSYGVSTPELHIDCLNVEPTVDLATGVEFPFHVIAQFKKFSLISEEFYGISEEEEEGYQTAFAHTINNKFKSFS